MQKIKVLGLVFLATLVAQSATAGLLTDISFTSNGGSFINDTIVNGTSPLAFTNTGATNNPFLNAANSTISLSFGSYYAISFLGFGQHLGSGSVSFVLDGTTSFSQTVTFPDNSPAGVTFATFALPGGDSVQISTTGLSADRIRIVGDGGGLVTDGTSDAFYLFSYTAGTGVPEPSSMGLAIVGLAAVALRLRNKK